MTLAHSRCANHASREAAGTCLTCGAVFCRECLVEHDGRLICSACLAKRTEKSVGKRPVRTVIIRSAQFMFAFLLIAVVFYIAGELLAAIPGAGTAVKGIR